MCNRLTIKPRLPVQSAAEGGPRDRAGKLNVGRVAVDNYPVVDEVSGADTRMDPEGGDCPGRFKWSDSSDHANARVAIHTIERGHLGFSA